MEVPMNGMRKKAVVVLAGLAVFAAGGAALAYWTVGGSGTGGGTADTGVNVTVVQTSTITAMHPGDSAQTLSGNFNNPNAGKVYIGTVTASISSVTKDVNAPAGTCDSTDFTLA